ncbi:MAG: oligopeptidase B, partial [Acidimicrobiia bacterium]
MPGPIAPRRPVSRELHGHVSVDDFGWLRHRGDPAVLEYLEAENRFTESTTAHLSDLREEIFLEIKSRVQETDVSAPARRGKWWYGHRTEEGKQYPIFVRWPGSPDAPEEVYLDQNLLAAGQDFCAIGLIEPAKDQDLIAYSVDHSGNEAFELRFRSLVTGEDFPDRIESTYYGGVWSTNAEWFFYTTIDEAHRPYRLWRHRLGTAPTDDILVWQEDDERFFLEVGASRDERFLIVHLESSTTSETRYLATGSPEDDLAILLPRVAGVRYQAEPSNGEWLVVTDAEAPNGKLISLNPGEPDKVTELIGHDPRVKLARVLPFGRHLVVLGRRQGNPAITVIPDDGAPFDVAFSEPSYRLRPGDNLEY